MEKLRIYNILALLSNIFLIVLWLQELLNVFYIFSEIVPTFDNTL